METLEKKLGKPSEYIEGIRLELGLKTQTEFANKLGYSLNYYNKVITNKFPISIHFVRRLSATTGLPCLKLMEKLLN